MAKEEKGKVRMTVIHFETESDNATLQANIHAIAQTLSRALAPAPSRPTNHQLGVGNGAGTSNEPEAVESDAGAIDAEIIPPPPAAKPTRPKTQSFRSPEVLELDFTSGDTPLRTFFDSKKPDNENRRYLVIAYWFKEFGNTPEVTMDHVHTAYRFLGLNTPKDASSPLRNLKSQGWMRKGSEKGAYAINHIGENEVNNMG